ncbi:PREDICTED: zinc finger protein 36, C3H1 type-like 2-B [Priapulus caudatus]|uniref:Zinc finger protein 36, C3H1 type-like 2-B n=1 Tax=Priapulus caudatus TaxID=37621 RepID=A0ABM1EQ53_PRICU|nr:PREDICTED: zinc finger protein 36, C3H1 type-like 2-B [Priapulus caudatus]
MSQPTTLGTSFCNMEDILSFNKNIQQFRGDGKAVGAPVNVATMNNQNFMNHPLWQAHTQLRRTVSVNSTCPTTKNDNFGLAININNNNNNNNIISQQSFPSQISAMQHQMSALSPTDLQANDFHMKLEHSMSDPGDRGSKSQTNSSRYKTEMCRPFEENGTCKYGDKCQFAHGQHELRNLSRHPKYKTELCRTFHTIGFCPYGPRCHFIHNPDEMRSPPPSPVGVPPAQRGPPMQQRAARVSRAPAFSVGGSLADSPTSSLSTSPVSSSPTLFEEDPFSMFSPAVFTAARAFTFPDAAAVAAPLPPPPQVTYGGGAPPLPPRRVHPQPQRRFVNDDVFLDLLSDNEPPSPTRSLSDRDSPINSPLDVSRGLRLPIFSRLSINDE